MPGYIGGEYGEGEIKWSKFNYCICFPDVYEVAMSNLGIKIVAESLKTVDGVFVDRCFSPWEDFGEILKEEKEDEIQQPRLVSRALARIKVERELSRGGLTSWVKC